MVHADPAFSGVVVYYFTGYCCGQATGPNPATTPGLADYDNQHPYPVGGPPSAWVNRTVLSNETPPTGAAVYTETGYSNTGTFGDNQGLAGQASYTLDLLMDDAANGIAHTYLYELMEEGDGFGLFDANNNPTPAATGIHNLTTILADNGANATSFVPSPIGYVLANMPNASFNLTLQKSNGATDIIVWDEPYTVPSPAVNVTATLNATAQTVNVYDPLAGTTPIQTLTNVNSITLGVTDHPLIVEVEPGGAPTIIDAGFETPSVGAGSYQFAPTGAIWTFTGNSGIQSNGSAFAAPAAPDGTQTAFLEEVNALNGTISQTINFSSTGSFTVSLQAAAMPHYGGQTFNVLIDGTVVEHSRPHRRPLPCLPPSRSPSPPRGTIP